MHLYGPVGLPRHVSSLDIYDEMKPLAMLKVRDDQAIIIVTWEEIERMWIWQ